MKKIAIALIVAMFMVSLAACGNSSNNPAGGEETSNAAGKTYTMKLTNVVADDDPLTEGYYFLKEILEERTNGVIKVEIFNNKQLANGDREQAEMVQQNMVQMCTTPSFILAALSTELNEYFIYDYPYMFETNEELYEFSDGELGQEMAQELLDVTGIRTYGGFNLGWVKISSNSKPIMTPDDIKGLKIRTSSSDIYVDMLKRFGISPTPISYGELFTALQQKTVDGMMTSTGLYASDRFYEVQKYMGCMNPYSIFHHTIINESWRLSLPEDIREIFDECMWEYQDWIRNRTEEYELESIEFLREQGMDVQEYTEEQLQAFKDIALPTWEAQKGVVGEEFFDRAVEFLGKA